MASGNDIGARDFGAKITGAKVRALSEHWHGLNGGVTPPRALFDPMAIPELLPHMYLVDLEPDPFRIRYRLTGTKADEWNGFNITGRYVDEFLANDIYGANRILIGVYREAWLSGRPAFGIYHWPTRGGLQMVVGFGVFPLTLDGRIAQALAIEDIEATPNPDEWAPFEDPAKQV